MPQLFINADQLESLLIKAKGASQDTAKQVIDKALELKGLSLEETAILIQNDSAEVIQRLFTAARQIKEKIYGQRLVLFAPLYIANYCSNNCLYCGFRKSNQQLQRVALSMDEIAAEVATLEREGHKRLLMLCGENHEGSSLDYFVQAIETAYSVKTEHGGDIRRINVEIAPLSVKEFQRLKSAKIGTYLLFQETYDPVTYKKMHPSGPKADYENRLFGMHRAMEAGIDDVGIGALFGLRDWRFEVLAMLAHSLELEKTFGVGPHTISVPRLQPTKNTPLANQPPAPVSDNDFKRLVAIIRLAVPYTGMILSTRESTSLRNEIFGLGISQISAGSRTNPGGYQSNRQEQPESEQFSLHDDRSLLEVVKDITKMGFYPSFCTACYRLGRTGHEFMEYAKPGEIQSYCLPNAILTFQEYLTYYGDDEAKNLGRQVIDQQLKGIKTDILRHKTAKKLDELAQGKTDLYF
ncbi:[FeFe] hydrogenase H-cluster radical SAM maturase HydG [candidate division WOR-1 bacterium RIFOXYB2_FULL_48_7]|uniref:[FeFe] hydrogenase H-cluster radical SAM maturase HydG n=1 Tax=candidate division WOR-1 bacterium RIFOXYB2_FULL_48_7 TaxID=1802583 RepID=A0A1F4TSL9_UNCSA|nr:MAG: [FeFe] hydrogenase H-cluster radical SAM maturase HydG [candidate division WOR-1 bacterium RIFOXYB2_FULL_48_7]